MFNASTPFDRTRRRSRRRFMGETVSGVGYGRRSTLVAHKQANLPDRHDLLCSFAADHPCSYTYSFQEIRSAPLIPSNPFKPLPVCRGLRFGANVALRGRIGAFLMPKNTQRTRNTLENTNKATKPCYQESDLRTERFMTGYLQPSRHKSSSRSCETADAPPIRLLDDRWD